MANAAALINEGLWRKDKAFQALPRMAQCTFLQVLSQKDLDCAGVLTLYLELLAKGCNELTVDQLEADFTTLEKARFLFVDYDTDELLIRSYVRLVSVKSPNAWKSAFKSARLVVSEKIRHELAVELRRIRRSDADALAAEIDPNPNPSEPHRNPIPNPSERDNPSEPHSEPPRSVPVVGHLTSVGTSVGEDPRPECPDHETNYEGGACLPCKRRREWDKAHPDHFERQKAAEKRQRATERQKAIDACVICDEFGDITLDDSVRKCDHQAVRHA